MQNRTMMSDEASMDAEVTPECQMLFAGLHSIPTYCYFL